LWFATSRLGFGWVFFLFCLLSALFFLLLVLTSLGVFSLVSSFKALSSFGFFAALYVTLCCLVLFCMDLFSVTTFFSNGVLSTCLGSARTALVFCSAFVHTPVLLLRDALCARVLYTCMPNSCTQPRPLKWNFYKGFSVFRARGQGPSEVAYYPEELNSTGLKLAHAHLAKSSVICVLPLPAPFH
jgi:hypothetical protein